MRRFEAVVLAAETILPDGLVVERDMKISDLVEESEGASDRMGSIVSLLRVVYTANDGKWCIG